MWIIAFHPSFLFKSCPNIIYVQELNHAWNMQDRGEKNKPEISTPKECLATGTYALPFK